MLFSEVSAKAWFVYLDANHDFRQLVLSGTQRVLAPGTAIHANAIDGLAYAFQSDDHCDVSSYVSLINPSVLTITLND